MPADQIKKRDARYGFDYTTSSGQKRLMYKSMGRDIDPDAKIDIHAPGDYGADPMGESGPNMKYKMVPSGDIVDQAEKDRRLSREEADEFGFIVSKMMEAKEARKKVKKEKKPKVPKMKRAELLKRLLLFMEEVHWECVPTSECGILLTELRKAVK
jgi:hypothetical protein